MKKIQTFLSLLLLVVFMTGCIFGDDDKTSSSSSNAIIGTWEYWTSERETVTFNNDGTFNFTTYYFNPDETENIYGTYTISGSIMTLTYREWGEEYVDKYTYSVSGNTLTMKSVYYDFTLEYTKVKS